MACDPIACLRGKASSGLLPRTKAFLVCAFPVRMTFTKSRSSMDCTIRSTRRVLTEELPQARLGVASSPGERGCHETADPCVRGVQRIRTCLGAVAESRNQQYCALRRPYDGEVIGSTVF